MGSVTSAEVITLRRPVMCGTGLLPVPPYDPDDIGLGSGSGATWKRLNYLHAF